MKTVESFKKQQAEAIRLLNNLLEFIKEGNRFIDFNDSSAIENLKQSITTEENKNLKVALIGGFSEGKTSIAAAWSGNYDETTMDINQEESTDDISVYKLEKLDLIDTPGLFGYKENKDHIEYKKITKDYVSSANLVLYVMNPNNPIKESHKEELLWLFKELNLLSRTVFVIGRFDEEVDIEDEQEYYEGFNIKKSNILERLQDFNIINESQEVPIVAVSANPFGEGLDYWLENMDEYRELSKIDSLQTETNNLIENSGGNLAIIRESQQSIVQDIFLQKVPVMNRFFTDLSLQLKQLEESHDNLELALEEARITMQEKIRGLRDFIMDLFTDLILQVNGTEMDTFYEFVERNIGDEGIVLNNTILGEFERQLNSLDMKILKIEVDYTNTINHFTKTLEHPAKSKMKVGTQLLKNSKLNISNTAVLRARDILMPSIKFKPWGAVKLASGISKGLPLVGATLGLGMELWDSYNKYQKQQEFEKVVTVYIDNFNKQRAEFVSLMEDDKKFAEIFFPSILKIEENINNTRQEIDELKKVKKEFNEWKNKGLSIKNEFESLIEH